ncbi:Na+/H+ antiporter NhaA [Clavibacter nebraskensis]|uniref:Na(+)/H(+) antiporter NhaA n=2 Tax=Clavibacter nebraskensis TaxID=31963 RepID=A0AAI8ZJM1_9MICO|nr:Na+/H+ antiporter NhaA [Clavibacter nebraskensis]KXU20033.1 sodium:proton antiporter [Clavibacter nebraskensis]OAH19541.1 sodium:proton antiporter [Clavibacter nebraskensis]QGV67344.1 Na+/H+ antiporter NhaA [Clavibacter nebraskensis]QGV70140.1 Na+/H+ antiporter NhaA [Clavibacter nebraskensis]QGV72931.1 Na+/H+ antiporter NhaA [Clavibacter nebraskensis]
MTSLIRSERVAAGLLLLAAVVGLVVANTPAGPGLLAWADGHVALPAIGVDLSLRHWVSDGLLVVFFFIVAVELKHEFLAGGLNSVSRALVPAIAAVGGVVVPAGVYLAITAGSGLERGWPVPTATDIAFALGVLAVFGRGLPAAVRVFLLALAVLDDLIAIGIIAVFFTTDLDLGALGLAVVGVVLFAVVGRLGVGRTGAARIAVVAPLVLIALVTWWATLSSGVHATIAGVALGFALPRLSGLRAAHALEPVSNGIVLPLFAFSAALVAIPAIGLAELAPAFWGIALALPLGKLVGITAGGLLGAWIARRRGSAAGLAAGLAVPDLVTVSLLGGIGFTVSLLMSELAFAGLDEVRDEGTLAVLLGSGVAIVAAAVTLSIRSRRARRDGAADDDDATHDDFPAHAVGGPARA